MTRRTWFLDEVVLKGGGGGGEMPTWGKSGESAVEGGEVAAQKSAPSSCSLNAALFIELAASQAPMKL